MATERKLEDATLVTAGDSPVALALSEVVEKEETVPTVAVASPEVATATSKRAAKKAKKPKHEATSTADAAADAEAESNKNIAATIDHPYLSFLHKRIRLYKKKLEKIKALETACANDGKVLNDQQQEVVGNKALVEKMISEFESLREQFIDVYLSEENEKTKQTEVELQQLEAKHAKEADATSVVMVVEESEVPVVESPTDDVAPTIAAPAVELPRDAFAYVEDLLRTLHAVTLHHALSKDVPPVLDYFSKVVLGTTRPPAEVPFEENLAESLEEATRYLTKSERIVALDYTYKDLRGMVEKLGGLPTSDAVEDVIGSPNVVGDDTTDNQEAMPVQAPVAEELPHINFFTDSQVEAELITAKEVDVEVVTEDKDNQHDAIPEAIEPTVSEEETLEEFPVNDDPAPVAAPPKSSATAVGSAPTGKHVWSRKPKSVTAAQNGSSDEKPNQRHRSQNRVKHNNNNNSNSPRTGDGKRIENSHDSAGASNNNSKPRRPRPQRTHDENSGPHNTHRADSAGGKIDDRRPRSERPVRKPQPQQQQRQQYGEAA